MSMLSTLLKTYYAQQKGLDPKKNLVLVKSRDGRSLNEEDIAALIAERGQARAAKDWAASDVIRDRLLAKGIVLKDGPKGTVWEFSQ